MIDARLAVGGGYLSQIHNGTLMLTEQRLASLLNGYPELTIALVGDLFLDRYLEIEPGVNEHSVETGLEAYQVTRVRNSPGALGTVLNNLAALGVGRLVPVTVIGDDGHGHDLLQRLRHLPVDASFILADPDRLTPTYTKPLKQIADGTWTELNRLDVKNRGPLSNSSLLRLSELLVAAFRRCDGLIVLDQFVEPNWGVVHEDIRRLLAELQRQDPKKLIFVDSRAHLKQFSCGVLKGNRTEILRACGESAQSDAAVSRATMDLGRRTGGTVFCTLGERGILVARPGSEPELVPGVGVTGPIDIVGAGDAATSGMVASLLAGANDLEAAAVGNLVASITVQQVGTTGTAKPEQIRSRWAQSPYVPW